jgi:hypothetical protein
MQMRTLLAIQAHGGMEPHIQRHYPFWKNSGLDILGIDRTDAQVAWPENIPHVSIGKSTYIDRQGGNMIKILVESFRYCLSYLPERYSDFMMIDYDAVIVRTPPPHPSPGFASFLASRCPPDWNTKSTRCFGTPWWMDRKSTVIFVKKGEEMIANGDYDNGAPDCYCGLILDRTDIPFVPVNAFHANTLDMRLPRILYNCKQAVDNGAWIIHGFRDEQHLDYVLGRIMLSAVKNVFVAPPQ